LSEGELDSEGKRCGSARGQARPFIGARGALGTWWLVDNGPCYGCNAIDGWGGGLNRGFKRGIQVGGVKVLTWHLYA
jgi:hypothetical protein